MAMLGITKVKIVGLKSLSLQLDPQTAKPEDKYIVKNIDGLGPPQVPVSISQTDGGGHYGGRQPANRELVITVGLNPDWDKGQTPDDLREDIYNLLSTGYDPYVDVRLHKETFVNGVSVADTPIAHDRGYVTNIVPNHFSKDPEVQITIDCLNPWFSTFFPVTYLPSSIGGTKPVITNSGTVQTGFQFAVRFTADRSDWFIKTTEDQNIGMRFKKNFHAGDTLAVSTIPGNKFIHWNKAHGKVQNVMGILTDDSEWLTLHPGPNHYVVPKTGWNWHGNFQFTTLYWGV